MAATDAISAGWALWPPVCALLALTCLGCGQDAPSATKDAGSPAPKLRPAPGATGFVIVDAGSSGSKVTALWQTDDGSQPNRSVSKYFTQCLPEEKTNGFTNMGVAALAYPKSECTVQVGTDFTKLQPLTSVNPQFLTDILTLVKEQYAKASGGKSLDMLSNAQEVPMIATGGMRLLSQKVNDDIWGELCGKEAAGLRLAPQGERCGVIPGTDEAYYEWLANAANGEKSRALTGTFTIGGASAQIAVPLRTEADVQGWKRVMERVKEQLDCTKLTLDGGLPAPVLNRFQEGLAAKEACLQDYISYRPRENIHAAPQVLKDDVGDIAGLGVVSFLGLKGRGGFVAAGVNEIANWAAESGCDSNATTFDQCTAKLQEALSEDCLWTAVREYFDANALDVTKFSFNTPVSLPQNQGVLPNRDAGNDYRTSAWRLKDDLERFCNGTHNADRFGFHAENTCMKAYWVSLYTVAFFSESTTGAGQSSSEIYQDPHRDYTEGFIQDSKYSAATSLLETPLSRHSEDYLVGARLHFSESGGVKPELWLVLPACLLAVGLVAWRRPRQREASEPLLARAEF